MPDSTAENLATVVAPIKQDWKAVATLLVGLLVLLGGLFWFTSGQILKGAATNLSDNTSRIVIIESKQASVELKVSASDKRMDELLAEFKALNVKISTVAESQARMEGFILGKK